MNRWLVGRLHTSDLWSNYRPTVPREPITLAFIGAFAVAGGLAGVGGPPMVVLGGLLVVPFLMALAVVTWIRRYRLALRTTILDAVAWRTSMDVLDVGTGSGMLAIGAAARATGGRVVGLDVWEGTTGGGSLATIRRNALTEGVEDRLELVEADARQMPFGDANFDVVMASGAVHHIVRDRADFGRLIDELTRVLRAGGAILLWDVPHIVDVSEGRLRAAGFVTSRRPTAPFLGFANHLLVARKPDQPEVPARP
jgi:SAM-dependent methyltransferase